MRRKYTDKQFINAVKSSISIREALIKLHLKPAGGNYQFFRLNVKRLNLDISHFLGKSHLLGKHHNWVKKQPLSVVLVRNSDYKTSNQLRRRLLKEKILEPKCSCCKRKTWMGKPISLELDHINGVRNDNRIENLRLLCPNCHAQTDTYRGKNIGRSRGI